MENLKDREELYKRAIQKWGKQAQVEMLLEEAIELALATRKFLRNDKDDAMSFQNFIDEITDVEIMIEQIKTMIPSLKNSVEARKEFKLNRLKERVEKTTLTRRPEFHKYNATEEERSRIERRLAQMERLGMKETGLATFGIEGVMCGLYIERVWSYSDEEWEEYIKELHEKVQKIKYELD